MASDRTAREAIENGSSAAAGNQPAGSQTSSSGSRDAGKAADRLPAAGPHAKEHLTDHDKTPGTGSLPSKNSADTDAGPD